MSKKFLCDVANTIGILKKEIPKVEEFYEGMIERTSLTSLELKLSDEEQDLVLWHQERIHELYDILDKFISKDIEFMHRVGETFIDVREMTEERTYTYYSLPANKSKLMEIYMLVEKLYVNIHKKRKKFCKEMV